MTKLKKKINFGRLTTPKEKELVVFTACDSVYLKYANVLVRSVDRFSPGLNFVLHVINPNDDDVQFIESLRASLVRTRLIVTTEKTDLSGLSASQKIAYYASARFIVISSLLDAWRNNNFLALDADAIVLKPLANYLDAEDDSNIRLFRRDLDENIERPEELRFAVGTVWYRNCAGTRDFMFHMSAILERLTEEGQIKWYDDQKTFYRTFLKFNDEIKIGQICKSFNDWSFSHNSVIWQGKGVRKETNFAFQYLSLILAGLVSTISPASFRELSTSTLRLLNDSDISEYGKPALCISRRVVILLPRLDLPWKRPVNSILPPLYGDTLDLRLYWVQFATKLAHALQSAGLSVEIKQLPAWEIERPLVESLGASLVFVPHRCFLDFGDGPTPVIFYMQEYFRWVFIVDRLGWSAASSAYPFSAEVKSSSKTYSPYEYYRAKIRTGDMPSKFSQPISKRSAGKWKRTVREIKHLSDVFLMRPKRRVKKIFFPIQIRHDQAVRYFSEYSFDDVLEAVVQWGKGRQVEVNLKPHPANKKLMERYFMLYPESSSVRWRNENIHDLIDDCDAVFLVNSGVGFEALLHDKPIVMFGKAEYDCVAIRARPDDIDSAWRRCLNSDSTSLTERYRLFFDWFMSEYAIDLSRDDVCDERFKVLTNEIIKLIKNPFNVSSRSPINYVG